MKPIVKNVVSLLVTAAVSVGLLWGGDLLTRNRLAAQESEEIAAVFGEIVKAERFERINTSDTANISGAWKALDGSGRLIGFAVTSTAQGYGGKIEVHTVVSADKRSVKGIHIGTHRESPGYGARVTEAAFTDQFSAKRQPFYLDTGKQRTSLRNGEYRAAAEEYDYSGFRDVVTITVTDGKISAVNWDGENQNGGATKKELSRSGNYVMNDTGLPWHAQAEIMEKALLALQDPTRISYHQDTGKTDAYSGATISVSPFVTLAAEAVAMARSADGTAIDGVSGATTSSQAVINAVNEAVAFVNRLS